MHHPYSHSRAQTAIEYHATLDIGQLSLYLDNIISFLDVCLESIQMTQAIHIDDHLHIKLPHIRDVAAYSWASKGQ